MTYCDKSILAPHCGLATCNQCNNAPIKSTIQTEGWGKYFQSWKENKGWRKFDDVTWRKFLEHLENIIASEITLAEARGAEREREILIERVKDIAILNDISQDPYYKDRYVEGYNKARKNCLQSLEDKKEE